MLLVFEYDKGVSNQDEVRLPQGFVTFMQNWIYDPDDRDRIFKIFGREACGSLPSGATTGNTFGLGYLQYENSPNKFIVLSGGALYETVVADRIGAWTQVVDKQAVPAAFPITGSLIKTIATGDNRYIVFDGSANMRPMIRDEGGDWHYLGLNAASPVTVSGVNLIAVTVRPTLATTPPLGYVTFPPPYPPPPTTPITPGTNLQLAYDSNIQTYATIAPPATTWTPNLHGGGWDALNPWTVSSCVWSFPTEPGATLEPQQVSITIGTSIVVQPTGGFGARYDFGGNTTYVQISTDGGTNFSILGDGMTYPFATRNITTVIGGGVNWSDIRIAVASFSYYTVLPRYIYVYDISITGVTTGGRAFIPQGTYTYCVTEAYSSPLLNGQSVRTEGPPSEPVSVTIAPNTSFGIVLTLPASQDRNTPKEGYKTDLAAGKRLTRYIYRTTSTGSWPDLGRIAVLGFGETTYVDNFETTSGTTLGSPPMNIGYAGVAAVINTNPAPTFADAVLFRSTLVAIPAAQPSHIQWSLPGFTDYWPTAAQDLSSLPTVRNDRLRGLGTVGEYLILFTPTRLLRMRDLPYVDKPSFDPALIQVDILSPNEGLAGGILSYCNFQSQKGFSVLAWVGVSGIWMTDGALPTENGLGIVKLTSNLNWRRLVDTKRLQETRLTYDPVLQMLFFDYYDTVGNFRTLGLHTAPDHWVASGQDHTVPKITGPHTNAKISRVIGDLNGELRHWSLDAARLKLYNERIGSGDDGQPILSVMETGWNQPGGPQEEYLCGLGSLYHSDWGPSETCTLDLLARRDDTGVIQELRKSGVSLAGAAVENFYINIGSKSFRLRLTHDGLTSSTGQAPIKALGPVGIDGEVMDAMFGV